MPVLMTGKWGTEVTAGAEPSVLAAFPSARGSPERAPRVGLGVMEEANPTREDGLMALQALLKYFREELCHPCSQPEPQPSAHGISLGR